jgi:4-amino-4-deoxy-L-arabinose transferase-like glycosyltransferase
LPADYKRSFLYPFLVSLIMSGVRATGVASPDTEMLMVRLAHALYSLLAIALVFRILDRTAGRESALIGGALMATFYPMPVTSVHQLEEVVCQVPLLAGCYLLLRAGDVDRSRAALSGVVTGLALILRFQLLSFVLPLLLLVWHGRRTRVALWWTVGLLLVLGLQGASNAVVNGEWWFSFKRYYGTLLGTPDELVLESNGYPSGPIWRYVLTVLGAFVPPFSLVAVAAMIIGGRRLWCLGLPTLVFFVAHSLIANKQERFLLPVLPMLVLLAAAGGPVARRWFVRRDWSGMYRTLWVYFGLVNLSLLLVTVFSYGKKDRVAPLVTIQRRGDATGVVVAQYNQTFSVPVYYLGRTRPPVVRLKRADSLGQEQVMRTADGRLNYAILYSDSIQSDSASLARLLARPLARVATIRPSLTDRLAHRVNPRHNKAKIAIVYTVRQ